MEQKKLQSEKLSETTAIDLKEFILDIPMDIDEQKRIIAYFEANRNLSELSEGEDVRGLSQLEKLGLFSHPEHFSAAVHDTVNSDFEARGKTNHGQNVGKTTRRRRSEFWFEQMKGVIRKAGTRARSQKKLELAEFLSWILPRKIRAEAFEPAYNDAKADYLTLRSKCKSKFARRGLALWFVLYVALMVGQCLFGMSCEKLKSAVSGLLPSIFRRL